MRKSFLMTHPPIMEFSFLGGVKPKSVELVQDTVNGVWADTSHEIIDLKSPLLCEKFANWKDTPERIVEFTKKYGPLRGRPCWDAADHALSFSFTLNEWRANQDAFRNQWNFSSRTPLWAHRSHENADLGLPPEVSASFRAGTYVDNGNVESLEPGEKLQFQPGKAILHVNSLLRLMRLQMSACPREYLKVCRFCEECFIEPDKRVVYCGKLLCRKKGKNESNKLAWGKNKAKWASKRR